MDRQPFHAKGVEPMSNSTESGGTADEADGAEPYADPLQEAAQSKQTVDNDAVAGETVYPGPGEGNNGPTGGAEREIEPVYDEHGNDETDGAAAEGGSDIDLDDQ
jgi:hypothetical protein